MHPLSAADAASIPNALHIPETIGAVTVAYNLPGVSLRSSLNWTKSLQTFSKEQ